MGSCPILFVGKFEYYECFVDAFSMYMVYSSFKKIWVLVLFSYLKYMLIINLLKKIKNLQSNSGGEFAYPQFNLHLQ